MNFVFAGLILVTIVRAQDLGASPALIGGMFAFLGGGAIIGSIAAPTIQRRFGSRRLIVTIAWFWALQVVALAFAPNVLLLGLLFGAGSLAGPTFNVVFGTIVYQVTPERLLGRVRSTAELVAWGAIPIGSLTAGLLTSGFGPIGAFLVLAIGMLIVAVAATFAPGMRHLPAGFVDRAA